MRHVYECPLRWADMDQLAHINNVSYADYLQEARLDFVRALGIPLPAGEGLVVVRQELRFLAPLTFRPEPVLVSVRVIDVRAGSFTLAYEIFDEGPDGPRTYLTGRTLLTPFDLGAQRPRRLRPDEVAALQPYLEPEDVSPPLGLPAIRRDPRHRYPVRVRFSDLDPLGHVNNVAFVEYLQEARIAVISRLFGEVPGTGRGSVVVGHIDLEYRRQLTMRPEPYEAWTGVVRVGRTSTLLGTEIVDPLSGEVAARGQAVLVFFDATTQRSASPPPEIHAALVAAAAEQAAG
ncbi:acyl-CoA thioesterase [Nocardioides sp. TRM66260-LWL]|uniref:acyl-CoA thioesterase n=1 Tax=Nocardioides sp. TRM66260-LWL TaxID=2874478 RepID=UPI001CC642E6|nr:thioesterase family protein [Nocardioides sp. TRM66260-LWL]MBZ5733008.1 acyl-CoA thioesterase [Nocardioides sp. TRM66260-LWL]